MSTYHVYMTFKHTDMQIMGKNHILAHKCLWSGTYPSKLNVIGIYGLGGVCDTLFCTNTQASYTPSHRYSYTQTITHNFTLAECQFL